MGILGIHLAWISVKNLDAAIQFYTTTIGLTLREKHADLGWAELSGPEGIRLGLAQYSEKNQCEPPVNVGSNAIVTVSVTDLEETKKMYQKKGVLFLGSVVEVPGHVKMQMCQDPDKNLFQLVQML